MIAKRTIPILMIISRFELALVATVALFSVGLFAEETQKKEGPCKIYLDTCSTNSKVVAAKDPKKMRKAMHACVSKAAKADAENGQACLATMAKYQKSAERISNPQPSPAPGSK